MTSTSTETEIVNSIVKETGNKYKLSIFIINIIILFCLFPSVVQASSGKIDSLFKLIRETSGSDTNAINNILDKSFPDKNISIHTKLNYSQALYDLYNKYSIEFRRNDVINALANFHYFRSNYYAALHYYLEIEKLYADRKEFFRDKQINNYNIALTLYKLENYKEALNSLTDYENFPDSSFKSGFLFRVYDLAGLTYDGLKNYKLAEKYFIRAMYIAEENTDSVNLAMVNNNLGLMSSRKNDYNQALLYYRNALNINLKIGNKRSYYINILNIAYTFTNLAMPDSALKYLELFQKEYDNISEMSIIQNYYLKLTSYYKSIGKYQEALDAHFRYHVIKDSIQKSEKYLEIKRLNEEFDVKRDIQENMKLKENVKSKEIKLAENRLLLAMALIIIGLGSALFYFMITRNKKNKEINELLKKKNSDIEKTNEELNKVNRVLAVESQKLVNINKRLSDSETTLKRINSEKDRFFSIISHDIRDPLQSLMLGTELLNLQLNKGMLEKAAKNSKSITKAAHNLKLLMENLFTWAEAKSGSLELIPVETKPVQIIQNIRSLYNKEIEIKKLTFDISIPDIFTIRADMNMFHTIFKNLITNAIKFSHENGAVEIGYKELDGYLLFTVKDYGLGISEENLEKLFRLDTVYSTRGTMNETGTGLGLIICQEFVERHGGKIWVESKQHEWTKFYFTMISDL